MLPTAQRCRKQSKEWEIAFLECGGRGCTLHGSRPPQTMRSLDLSRGTSGRRGRRGNPFHAPGVRVGTSPGFGRWARIGWFDGAHHKVSVLRLRDERFDATKAASHRLVGHATKEAKICVRCGADERSDGDAVFKAVWRSHPPTLPPSLHYGVTCRSGARNLDSHRTP